MNTILYISYGSGPHEQEVIFSLLSALRWVGPAALDLRFLILTDRPTSFAGLPATVEYISPERWDEWAGPTRFNHRRKIMAIQHALARFDAPTVLLDGDTWLRRSPRELFARIEKGRTIMHIREARIVDIDSPQGAQLNAFLEAERFSWSGAVDGRIPRDRSLWNAGVIGMHPEDVGLLDEVLALTDDFCSRGTLHILEQLAFCLVLAERTSLVEAQDIVFHYWPPYLHEPFRKVLPPLAEATRALPLEGRIDAYHRHRPRPTVARRLKVIAKRILQTVRLVPLGSRSNEW